MHMRSSHRFGTVWTLYRNDALSKKISSTCGGASHTKTSSVAHLAAIVVMRSFVIGFETTMLDGAARA